MNSPWIREVLASAQTRGLSRLDAQLLLLHALGRGPANRAWLLAHDDTKLSTETAVHFEALIQRRLAGEPVAYLTGNKEFFGLTLQVDCRVLVPRPETETLVQWALDVLQNHGDAQVVDLGTGSGAIALALRQTRPNLQVTAVDASVEALQVAQANAARLGLNVSLRNGHWLDGLETRFDLIVSNPPYIAEEDPHLADLRHEPTRALASGVDGLADLRLIIAQSPAHLRPGGWLLLEHGWDQAAAVRQLLRQAGMCDVQTRRDLAGIERCSGARFAG